LDTVGVVSRLWAASDVRGAVDEVGAHAEHDPALAHSTIASICAQTGPLGLKLSTVIAPLCVTLLQNSQHEDHLVTAVKAVSRIAVESQALLHADRTAPARDAVDIAADERHQRLVSLRHALRSAAAIVAALQTTSNPAHAGLHNAVDECKRRLVEATRT
jgi:hypothetical protein